MSGNIHLEPRENWDQLMGRKGGETERRVKWVVGRLRKRLHERDGNKVEM